MRVTAAIAEEFPLLGTPVRVAIEHVVKLKAELREDSARTYKSTAKLFVEYLEKSGWGEMEIGEVTKVHANGYLDDCIISRKLSPTSWNNQMSIMRTIFNALKERGYVQLNPFADIKKKKELPKSRKCFSVEAARVVMERVRAEDELLFYGCLIQYCCHYRPTEIHKMRFRDVDLQQGLIYLDSGRTKDKDNRVATIPQSFRRFFDLDFFTRCPANYFIFGEGWKPGTKKAAKQVAFRRHQKILQDLQREGKLTDLTGLVYYSWKDTGMTHALEKVSLLAVPDQAGHRNSQVTLRYRHKEEVNAEYQDKFENKILPK